MNVPSSGRIGFVRSHQPRTRVLLRRSLRPRLEFCVPDLLYRRELEPYGGDRLRAMGLRVLELDDIGVSLWRFGIAKLLPLSRSPTRSRWR